MTKLPNESFLRMYPRR